MKEPELCFLHLHLCFLSRCSVGCFHRTRTFSFRGGGSYYPYLAPHNVAEQRRLQMPTGHLLGEVSQAPGGHREDLWHWSISRAGNVSRTLDQRKKMDVMFPEPPLLISV